MSTTDISRRTIKLYGNRNRNGKETERAKSSDCNEHRPCDIGIAHYQIVAIWLHLYFLSDLFLKDLWFTPIVIWV